MIFAVGGSGRTVIQMRLIDADKLIKEVYGNPFVTDSVKTYAKCSVVDQPTIDAVEVVRCRDCKHRKEYNGQYHRCSVFERTVKNDDYCSFGERGERK